MLYRRLCRGGVQARYLIIIAICLFATAGRAAELSMTVNSSPAAPFVGETITFTITLIPVRTANSATVNDTIFTYAIPDAFELEFIETTQGICTETNSVIECDIGILESRVDISLTLNLLEAGVFTSNFFSTGTQLDEATGDPTGTSVSIASTVSVSEQPPVEISFVETSIVVDESVGAATFSVARSGESDRALTVDFATTDGTATAGQDYEETSGTLVWEEGDTSPKTFTIAVIDDSAVENRDETVNVVLQNPANGATLSAANAVLTIQDNESSGLVEFSTVNYRAGEDQGQTTITVVRVQGSDGPLTVSYATSDGSATVGMDYVEATGTLFWPAGDMTSRTFDVEILDDDLIEGDETLTLVLNTLDEALLGQRTATLTIVDNFTDDDAVAALMSIARNPTQAAMAEPLGRLCLSDNIGTDLQDRCEELIISVGVDPVGVSNALQQIAPEEYAAQGRMSIEMASRQFRNIDTRLMALRSGFSGFSDEELKIDVKGVPLPDAVAKPIPGQVIPKGLPAGLAHEFGLNSFGGFISGNISFGDRDTTDRESGFDFKSYGVTGGVDYRFNDKFIVGAALGYAKNDADLDANGGKLDANGFSYSLYGTFYETREYYVDAIVSWGDYEYDTSRNIVYTLLDTLVSQEAIVDNINGEQFSISVSGGYFFNFKKLSLSPTARVEYIDLDIDDFRETLTRPFDPGFGLGLEIDSQNVSSLTLAIGGNASYELEVGGFTLIPEIGAEFVGEFDNDSRQITGRFRDDFTGQEFSLSTDEADTSYLNLNLGLSLQAGSGKAAFLRYQTTLGLGNTSVYSLMGGIRLEF